MNTMQSFLMFFYILDQCYEQCQEGDLGGFLGAISPEIWEDGQPMDKAIFNDWKNYSQVGLIDFENIIEKTLDFLEIYENNYGMNFKKTKDYLISLTNKEIIEKAYYMVQIFDKKYGYSD